MTSPFFREFDSTSRAVSARIVTRLHARRPREEVEGIDALSDAIDLSSMDKCTAATFHRRSDEGGNVPYAQDMVLRAKILTVSDSASDGRRDDGAGPLLASRLHDAGYIVEEIRVIPDGVGSVAAALTSLSFGFEGLILTTGATGFSPRDLTPEGTLQVIE